MLAGLVLGTYLLALPFITFSFVLANADLALKSPEKHGTGGPSAPAPYADITSVKVY